ncbi:MAG: hypothetical protein IKU01_01770 [Bacteroidales bacterium]|nr:hypothetical protein [Bacteroidales bacterium]
MKDWKDTVREGMKLIQKGCRENEEWNGCAECPFDVYCTILMEDDTIEDEVSKFEGIRWLPD